MLLLRDILDPKYGMFEYYEDSRSIWFSENSFEDEGMYTLIGILCGLAIYNFTIINLPFPMALYKKLLKEDVDLADLRVLSPALANSMQSILDYAGDDLEEVFDLTFEITRECFGERRNVPLKPDGENIRLTQANKQEFVDLYIDFIFNKSVERHFKGFRDGFMKVCGSRVLELFKPHELMAAVIGNEDYDWHVLEEETEYKNGYESGDQTVSLGEQCVLSQE
jgi:E3 ubiquitin-protein ligase HERC4